MVFCMLMSKDGQLTMEMGETVQIKGIAPSGGVSTGVSYRRRETDILLEV